MSNSKRTLDWRTTSFLVFAHLMAVTAVVYMITVRFSWWTVALALLWFACCGISITGGYHRLFAHASYRSDKFLRLFYLLFGAASVQNSALKWSADHRQHHSNSDGDGDLYSITRGFWWAHIGWIFFKDPWEGDPERVKDLRDDPLVMFQHRFYLPLAIFFGAVLPGGLGFLWGDALGAFLVAGFLRLVVQWHATFSVNSFAHMIGRQPYCKESTARDSFMNALITLGEGYHNFHHRFPSDYRNGIRWFHFDPTKWFVWSLSKVGITGKLNRVPAYAIERARSTARDG